MDNFNIHNWRFNNLLKEETGKYKTRELDSETALDPLPKEWYSKYYTVDFSMDGPRFFDNKTGYEVDYMKIVRHYEEETGKSIVDLMETGKEESGERVYKTPSELKASANDLIKPQGGRQSSHFEVNEENELEALEAQKTELENSPVTDHLAERLRDINDKIDIIKANLNELTDKVDYQGYARKFLSELREAGIDRGDAERVIISMKANLGMIFEEVDEAKKKDPVRRDTEEERAGAQQAGRRMRTQVVRDKKAAYNRGDRKHKKDMYEKALEEANRQLEKRKQQNS